MSLPLSRFRVIDLTTVRSGPTCTKVLADFGADVLRVERPGDAARDRAFFDAADLHRNKKSLVLNLQHPKGYTVDQVFADSQVARSRLVREVEHPLWGLVSVLGLPVMLSCTPAQVRTAAPLSGQHTREVLAGLGYDRTAIEGLLADGVVEEAKGAKS